MKDWQLLRLQPWICPSWEPSQRHEFRLGGYERGYGLHWEWASVDLNLTAARSSKGKTLTSYQMDLYGFWWQFYEYLGDQRILSFSGNFRYLFCHEFTLILKSKWRDLNSRLGGCEICVSEIYFLNFLKNKEAKRLK